MKRVHTPPRTEKPKSSLGEHKKAYLRTFLSNPMHPAASSQLWYGLPTIDQGSIKWLAKYWWIYYIGNPSILPTTDLKMEAITGEDYDYLRSLVIDNEGPADPFLEATENREYL